MVGKKVREVQIRIKIGVGRILNDCIITKNENVASNMKLLKMEYVASIMKRRKCVLNRPNKNDLTMRPSHLKISEEFKFTQ